MLCLVSLYSYSRSSSFLRTQYSTQSTDMKLKNRDVLCNSILIQMTHSGYHILAAYCEGKINLINPCLVRIITVNIFELKSYLKCYFILHILNHILVSH